MFKASHNNYKYINNWKIKWDSKKLDKYWYNSYRQCLLGQLGKVVIIAGISYFADVFLISDILWTCIETISFSDSYLLCLLFSLYNIS